MPLSLIPLVSPPSTWRENHRHNLDSHINDVLDGVRAGAKRLGRKKERASGTPNVPSQPRPSVLFSYVPHVN